MLSCGMLDTPAEAGFDDLTLLACHLCDTPIALISLLDESRQWFKSRIGLEVPETPRDHAFCSHAILQNEPLVIPDATADPRTCENPLVTGHPHIRFYAGVPLVVDHGIALGTLCVIDTRPREVTPDQIEFLKALARQAASQIRIRQTACALDEARRQAQSANQAKSAFLAHMSHELRTPLTSILGYADLLDADPAKLEENAHFTEIISRNANHLLGIVNDILDLSKIEAGMMSLETMPIDPMYVLTEALGLAEARARSKSLPISVVFESSIPTEITTDPLRLRQVLLNLLSNAIKFTDDGAITIRVRADPADQTIGLTVSDTGVGMSEAQVAVIRRFEAFRQADSSTTRRFGGTGLGLRITHTLVHMLGGELSVDSKEGEGSSFTITLPCASTANSHTWRTAGEAESQFAGLVNAHTHHPQVVHPESDLDGVRILLAEDSQDSQRLITLHLKRAGAVVVTADNGDQAIRRIAADPEFDLVLMDVDMPVLDGLQATRRLRAQGFDRPIVFLSAHAFSDNRQRGLNAGGNEYLTKPIDPKKLIDTCQQLVGSRVQPA
ncbi:MAG: ATP-binding protein [Phycisphaerales bacterium JB064]